MKNNKIWIVIVVLLLIINSATLAVMWFHKKPAEFEHQRTEPKDVLISALALTPKQVDLYAGMRGRHQQLTRTLNETNHQLRDSLFDNIKSPVVDSAKINALTKRVSANQSKIEQATLYHFRELRGILTPAQQTKFDGIINEVLRMMARPGGGMQGPPQGGERPPGNRPPPPNGRDGFGPPPNGGPPGEGPPPN